jgi:hypothetical protein
MNHKTISRCLRVGQCASINLSFIIDHFDINQSSRFLFVLLRILFVSTKSRSLTEFRHNKFQLIMKFLPVLSFALAATALPLASPVAEPQLGMFVYLIP